MAIFEILEFIGHAGAFWLFVFSPPTRAEWVQKFREAGWGGKFCMVIKGVGAAACGLFPVTALILNRLIAA